MLGEDVARPALEDAELTRVVQADVERGIGACRKPAERPAAAVPDRAVTGVDRAHHVARDERLPPLPRTDAVDPLRVLEEARRSVRHDEDRRMDGVPGHEDVLGDADLVRPEKGALRTPREAVQQIEDRVSPLWMAQVARRQVDVHHLSPSPDRGALDDDPLRRATHLDERGVTGRPEASEAPVVVEVVREARQAQHEIDAEHRRRHGKRQVPAHPLRACAPLLAGSIPQWNDPRGDSRRPPDGRRIIRSIVRSSQRIFDRKRRVRSSLGAAKKRTGRASSMIWPSSIIATRSAASRANPIS